MTGLKRVAWMTLIAGILAACGEDRASDAATTGVSRGLLNQPQADDVATEFDASGLPGSSPVLSVEQLGVNMGSEDAPIKVIEFVDFGCGFCRRFQLETFPTIRTEFIETEMIEWKFMPFITGTFRNSPVVSEAAECALAQEGALFSAFQDRLWQQQSDWKSSSDPLALARAWATSLGADGDSFDRCMAEDTRLERVRSATALARQMGIRGTPTFWVVGGGPVQGALPLETFRQLFTQLYAQLTDDGN